MINCPITIAQSKWKKCLKKCNFIVFTDKSLNVYEQYLHTYYSKSDKTHSLTENPQLSIIQMFFSYIDPLVILCIQISTLAQIYIFISEKGQKTVTDFTSAGVRLA